MLEYTLNIETFAFLQTTTGLCFTWDKCSTHVAGVCIYAVSKIDLAYVGTEPAIGVSKVLLRLTVLI